MSKLRWMRTGALVAAVAGCAALVAASGLIEPGARVPDFTLPAVRGGSFTVRPATPQTALIAFLQTYPDTADTASRGEVALLESMEHQYGARGLRVAIVDATAVATGKSPSHDSLVNASYDWNLAVPLLEDDGRVAALLGVTRAPTVVLVKADGMVAQAWERRVSPGELAIAVEEVMGSGRLAHQ